MIEIIMFIKHFISVERFQEIRKKWYSFLAQEYESVDLRFMNYGFLNDGTDAGGSGIPLDPFDEKYRYPIQLYHHLVQEIQIENKNILEVGCGRGGGASYITRYFRPESYLGIDLAQSAIGLCKKYNTHSELSFLVAEAESLPFADKTFDVVINVESSHCYHPIEKFLASVHRVLVEGGYLLLTDFRTLIGLDELRRALFDSGLTMLHEKNITKNVFGAIQLEHQKKKDDIFRLMPQNLWPVLVEAAALEGSQTYGDFQNGDAKYMSYVLQKL